MRKFDSKTKERQERNGPAESRTKSKFATEEPTLNFFVCILPFLGGGGGVKCHEQQPLLLTVFIPWAKTSGSWNRMRIAGQIMTTSTSHWEAQVRIVPDLNIEETQADQQFGL